MKIRNLLSIAALTLMAGSASAGLVQPASVLVDLDNGTAQGDQWTARSSDNDVEFIGCGIRLFDFGMGSFEFGFCQAGDSEGVQIFCSTQNSDLLAAIRSTTAFAFVTFSLDENAECTRIGFSTQSFYLPDFALADDDDDTDND